MAVTGKALGEREELARGIHLACIELGEELLRKLLINEGHGAEKRPVEQRNTHIGAQADVLVGLKHRIHVLGNDAWTHIGVVAQGGGAAVHGLDRPDHGAQVDVTRR